MQFKTVGPIAMVVLLTPAGVWAGAGASSSGMGASSGSNGGGYRIEKINRHALKSTVLIRQLLVQNGVSSVTPAK